MAPAPILILVSFVVFTCLQLVATLPAAFTVLGKHCFNLVYSYSLQYTMLPAVLQKVGKTV